MSIDFSLIVDLARLAKANRCRYASARTPNGKFLVALGKGNIFVFYWTRGRK